MSLDLRGAAIAAGRFGMGARPGDLDAIAADPRGWLKGQLMGPVSLPRDLAAIGTTTDRARQAIDQNRQMGVSLSTILGATPYDTYRVDMAARFLAGVRSDRPLLERLARFWANHFTVAISKGGAMAAVVGPYETEAIRPHMLGRFADLLTAVTSHPAMLFYLDNVQSVGPDSPVGRKQHRGINENLGRELMELHTLGVGGGYTQADVDALAAILSGWTIEGWNGRNPGSFVFVPAMHQPGDKVLLGKHYHEGGMAEGRRALADLAVHPSTARHVSTQLARHFVADDPPPAAVDRLAQTWLKTGGDLRAVTLALIDLPEAWARPLAKLKLPEDLVISSVRALSPPGDDGPIDPADQRVQGLAYAIQALGQQPYNAPSPAGWPDTAAAWAGPEAIVRRVDWTHSFAQRVRGRVDPRTLLASSLGPLAGAATAQTVAQAPSVPDGIGLMLASPEFQRR